MDYLQVRISVSPLNSKNRGQADSCGEYPMHPRPTGSEGERDPRSSYNVLAWLVGEFVKCWLLMLFVCFVVAARVTPGAPRRLSPDQDSGLMLRGTSGVPGHQAQSGKGARG